MTQIYNSLPLFSFLRIYIELLQFIVYIGTTTSTMIKRDGERNRGANPNKPRELGIENGEEWTTTYIQFETDDEKLKETAGLIAESMTLKFISNEGMDDQFMNTVNFE